VGNCKKIRLNGKIFKNIHYYALKISHNPELIDLFPVELVKELIGCVPDVLNRRDALADHEDVRACLEGVFDDFDPDAACRPSDDPPLSISTERN
jgi:hypothetical protein